MRRSTRRDVRDLQPLARIPMTSTSHGSERLQSLSAAGDGRRATTIWGLAVQLYRLRSQRNWGIGDFGDLRALCRLAERAGAGGIGINPLHALASAAIPKRASPYAPIQPALSQLAGHRRRSAVPEARGSTTRHIAAVSDDALRGAKPFVDYTGVAMVKGALRA